MAALIPYQLNEASASRLKRELNYALNHTDKQDFKNYARNVGNGTFGLVAKRAVNLKNLGSSIFNAAKGGITGLKTAVNEQRLPEFLADSWESTRTSAVQKFNVTRTLVSEFTKALRKDPRPERVNLIWTVIS